MDPAIGPPSCSIHISLDHGSGSKRVQGAGKESVPSRVSAQGFGRVIQKYTQAWEKYSGKAPTLPAVFSFLQAFPTEHVSKASSGKRESRPQASASSSSTMSDREVLQRRALGTPLRARFPGHLQSRDICSPSPRPGHHGRILRKDAISDVNAGTP